MNLQNINNKIDSDKYGKIKKNEEGNEDDIVIFSTFQSIKNSLKNNNCELNNKPINSTHSSLISFKFHSGNKIFNNSWSNNVKFKTANKLDLQFQVVNECILSESNNDK